MHQGYHVVDDFNIILKGEVKHERLLDDPCIVLGESPRNWCFWWKRFSHQENERAAGFFRRWCHASKVVQTITVSLVGFWLRSQHPWRFFITSWICSCCRVACTCLLFVWFKDLAWCMDHYHQRWSKNKLHSSMIQIEPQLPQWALKIWWRYQVPAPWNQQT